MLFQKGPRMLFTRVPRAAGEEGLKRLRILFSFRAYSSRALQLFATEPFFSLLLDVLLSGTGARPALG